MIDTESPRGQIWPPIQHDAPERLWRRIGCIAYADLGVANLETMGLATAVLAGKQARASLGGQWAVAASVVVELSRAPKSRAADDLVMVCELHAAHADARAELPLLTTRELIAIATSQEAVEKRALALWYALGTDRRPTGLVSRPSLSSASAKKAALAAPFERFSNRFRASANERTTTSLNYGMDTLKLWDGHREIMGWTP